MWWARQVAHSCCCSVHIGHTANTAHIASKIHFGEYMMPASGFGVLVHIQWMRQSRDHKFAERWGRTTSVARPAEIRSKNQLHRRETDP